MRYAYCHPDRKYRAKGLCVRCYANKWRADHLDFYTAKHVRQAYGLSLDEYKTIVSRGCAICGTLEKINLDHDHKTKRVRGALCWQHNVVVGFCSDNPDELRALADYLEHRG